ncbi:MAG: Uma2 family endonuclease [Acidimicrobiales bacterium]
MKTVVLGPPPTELKAFIERRQQLRLDLFDEVWEGCYHVVPAPHPSHGLVEDQLARILGRYADAAGLVGSGPFNLGGPDNYRVPDRGYHRVPPTTTWVPTVAIAVEVVSPHDETFEKFDFFAQHHVDELLIAEPETRQVRCWRLGEDTYTEVDHSGILGVTTGAITDQITWP